MFILNREDCEVNLCDFITIIIIILNLFSIVVGWEIAAKMSRKWRFGWNEGQLIVFSIDNRILGFSKIFDEKNVLTWYDPHEWICVWIIFLSLNLNHFHSASILFSFSSIIVKCMQIPIETPLLGNKKL